MEYLIGAIAGFFLGLFCAYRFFTSNEYFEHMLNRFRIIYDAERRKAGM